MKRALIVGANGFLGKNLTKHLVEQGVEVCALVQKGNILDFKHPLLHCIEFELTSLFDVIPKITKQYEVLYYFAWIGVSTTFKNDMSIQSQNINYSLSVIDFANILGIEKLVYPGSASEYSCGNSIITGHNLPSPSDIYSIVKVCVHLLCKNYAAQKKIKFIWTNITSVYGPGRDDNNLITYTIKSLLSKQIPKFTKLEQKWDYIYISDFAKAFYLIGENGVDGKSYPIGSGQYQTLNEYVSTIKNMIDPESKMEIGAIPYKNKTIDHQVLDIYELTEDTGFVPDYSFEMGIKETILYYKNELNYV